jgi:hypothetical protein
MIVRRLAAAVGLVGLLGAPPYVIGRLVGNPILNGMQWDALRRTGTLDSPTALKLGGGLFYLVWFWLGAIALSEIVRVRQAQPDVTSTRTWSPANVVRRLVRLALATTVTTATIPVLALLPRSVPAAAVMAPPRSTAIRRTESSERVWEASGRDTALSVSIDVFGTEARREDIVRLNRGRTSPEGVGWQSGPFPKGMRILLPTDAPAVDVAVPVAVEKVTIQSGDNLWTLARGRLDVADGPASQPTDVQIADYTDEVIAGNADVFVQMGNADLIIPGQEFAFPALGNGAEAPVTPIGAQTSPTSVAPVATAPADEPPAASPAITVQRTSGSSSPTSSAHPSPSTAPISNGSLSRPTATTAVPLPPPTISPAPSPTAVSPAAVSSTPNPQENGHSSVPSLADRVGWLGSATLAAGLLAIAARRRRGRPRRQRRPTEATRDVDLALRSTPLIDSASWAADTLRAMPLPPVREGCADAKLEAVQVGESGLEVLWNRPQPDVPEGWTSVNAGWSWERARTTAAGKAIRLAAYPCLVTIGRREGNDVLINVEAGGIIEIMGPAATDVARAIVLELGATLHSDVSVTLTNASGIDGIEHITGVRSAPFDEIVNWLDHHRTTFAGHLTAAGHESLPHLRVAGIDTFEPAVAVIDATELADVDRDRVLAAAGSGAIAILINPSTPSGLGWQLECTTEQTTVQPLGFIVTPTSVSATTAESIVAMLADAGEGPTGAPAVGHAVDGASALVIDDPESILSGRYGVDPNLVTRETNLEAVDLVDSELVGLVEPWAIQFRVLGSVGCVTELAEPLQPKELEVAIFMALHRDGKTSDTIRTMVWPDQIADQRWHNLTTRIRQKLGMTGEGLPRLPKPGADLRYRLHESVVTDWDLFLGHARQAEQVAATEALEHYSSALDLIHGVLFGDVPAGYSWAYSDGTFTEMTTTIVTVAKHAAQLALDLEELELAIWLISRAYRAVERIEAQELVTLEMQTHLASGLPEKAVAAFDALASELEGDDPIPALAELRHRLITSRA